MKSQIFKQDNLSVLESKYLGRDLGAYAIFGHYDRGT